MADILQFAVPVNLSKWRVLSSKLILCLNGLLSVWDQLGGLVNILLQQGKSAGTPQRGLAACISGHFGISEIFRVVVGCNLPQLSKIRHCKATYR